MKKTCLLSLFTVLALCGTLSNAFASIPALERAALITLYNSTNGDAWTNKSGWKTPPLDTDGFAMPGTENGWHGVSCNGSNTNVTVLFLNFNQLTGSIPPELGNLSNLTDLSLFSNQLAGNIPPELGNLSNLTILFLASNQLTGNIPPELGNLSNLTGLYLASNQLTGNIPPELGNLANLTFLHLVSNQLTGSIPLELVNLSNLTNLNLSSNQLTGNIPPELGNLANLTSLYLCGNQLTGTIPTEIGNLTSLTGLSICENQLTGTVPAELGNLANLQRLNLFSNLLTGPLPVELLNLTGLVDDGSDFCDNYLYTDNVILRNFINNKQTGGDWESCQKLHDPGCVSAKLKAGSMLYRSYTWCNTREMNNPDYDLAACVSWAESWFEWRWDKAEDNAAIKEQDCFTASDSAIEDIILFALEDIHDQIFAGLDLGDRNARDLGNALMRFAQYYCNSLLIAEANNIIMKNDNNLGEVTSKAEEIFFSRCDWAIEWASKREIVIVDPEGLPDEVAGMVEGLAVDILAGMNLQRLTSY